MIDWAAVAAASVVCAAGVMSPGPNFIAVTHRAVTAHRVEAFALVLGVACVSALWAAAAVFGLGLLFSLFPWFFWSAKLVGAAYLVWFGIQLFRRSMLPLPEKTDLLTPLTFLSAFRDGLVTNLSNPKAMVFYASVFSAAVPAGASSATLAVMVLMVAIMVAVWYGGVALVLSSKRAARAFRRKKMLVERGCGAFLILFGLRQALSRQ
jgi:threonine/homoserine/homoserine lactone efflux protein